MKVAVMQPYLFAYLGYYQLIGAVDLYVSDDEVQYINKGWINRNRILCEGQAQLFTFSLQKDTHKSKINERVLSSENYEKEKNNFLKTLERYRRAPNYEAAFELVERIMQNKNANLASFVINSIREICSYLDIKTPIEIVSRHDYNRSLNGQARVIDICHKLNANEYINPIGGIELYLKADFAREGLKLHFLKMKEIKYPQFHHNFIPHLSIIDVLMFNDKGKCQELLKEYELK